MVQMGVIAAPPRENNDYENNGRNEMTTKGQHLILALILFVTATAVQSQEIFDAVRNGDLVKVKALIDKDTQLVSARTPRQSTPLHVAVSLNNFAMAEYIIDKGADLNAANGNQWTSLFYAHNVEMAKLLLDKGTYIDFGFPNYTALTHFIRYQNKEIAEYLLDRGATVPEIGTPLGLNSLINALKIGSVRYLEECMQKGFDPNYESEANSNLLHYASASSSVELINKLIAAGVSVNKKNVFGLAPLHIASRNGNTQVVKILLEHGARIDDRTNDGRTPMNLAMEAQKDEVAEFLKSAGADQGPQLFPALTGEYMGQPKPGDTAVPFGLGIVSGQYTYHGSIVFTPDGHEMYWSAYLPDGESTALFHAREVDGQWTTPEVLSQSDVPFVSPDGQRLFFVGTREDQGTIRKIIFARDKTSTGWSTPYALPDVINAMPGINWQVSVDNNGTLYFGAQQKIYVSQYRNGQYEAPETIASLNDLSVFSPFIAPDGSYLIATKEEEGERLIILFRTKDGGWTIPTELGDLIGMQVGLCPIVTHDSKYLFFIGNLDGMYIPYWVDAEFIEELRPKK
jgi:ankyrin repeat protein